MYSWYEILNKPLLSPPAIVFQIVWPILYILMAISFILFIKGGFSFRKVLPLTTFLIQFGLNLAWSPVFFGLHNMKMAFVIVVLMVIFTLITIILFYRISKTSAYLLLPYLLWIIFASYLNFEFIRLN